MNAVKKILSLLLLLAMLSACFAMADEAPASGSEASAPAVADGAETDAPGDMEGAQMEKAELEAGASETGASGMGANPEETGMPEAGTESEETDVPEAGAQSEETTALEAGTGDEEAQVPGDVEAGLEGEKDAPDVDGMQSDGQDVPSADEADGTPRGDDTETEEEEAIGKQVLLTATLAEEPTEVSDPADGLNGTTVPVDSATSLPDGSYAPEDFSWSGGSGRTKLSCGEVKASGEKFAARHEGGSSIVEIPVKLNVENRIIGMTTAMSETGKEIEYMICVRLSEGAGGNPEETVAPQETEVAGETDAPVYEDGDYDICIESTFKMFEITSRSAKMESGKLFVTIGTSKQAYDRIYIGSKNDAADYPSYVQGSANAGGGYDFTFELPLSAMGTRMDFVPGKPDGSWYSKNQYQFTVPATIERVPGAEETPEPEEKPTEVDDGEYKVAVESSSSMFKVVSCRVTVCEGKCTAVIALSGTGYDKLYLGTAEAAAAADAAQVIPFEMDAEGLYSFAFPVEKLDAEIAVAAHSAKKDAWYDRTLVFKTEGMERLDAPEASASPEATARPEATPAPSPTPTPAPEADLNGSTGRVNSSTSLADGVYKPDKFSCSGGSGRVSVSCTQITVSGGKAKATIVFSSPNYGYVKANGQKYYGSHGGDSSTFEIPVKLNSNNKVIGMTTAMSTEHEVTYTMYFYLKAAEAAETQEVPDAPEVPGLTCVSVDENDAARLFRLSRYAQGYTAIEVEGVGAYLIVPEGAELPAGVEEEMTVIRRPLESVYAATEEIYARIEFCGAEAAVKLTGFDAGDALVCAGSCAELDYAALLKEKCDLAIVPEAFADGRVCGRDAAYRCAELTDEGAAALADAAERLGMLGISMFVDRAMDEESAEACLEWLKVYGVLLDCEAEAVAAYEAAVA